MASLLEIHYADIRVVSIWPVTRRRELRDLEEGTGTLAIEFEVYQGELTTAEEIENEDPSFFDKVLDTFSTAMSTIVTFMETPVLNAVSQDGPVETPASKEAAANNNGEDAFFFGGESREEVEPEIITEIRYKEAQVEASEETPAGQFTYGMLLGIIIVALALILLSVCLYNKYSSKRDKVVKEVTDQTPIEKIKAQKGRLESHSIEQQYRPEQTEEGDFGGVAFTQDGRSSTLVALRSRDDKMQRTGDKWTLADDPNFGDSENSINLDLSGAKLKKKETTTAKKDDYDSGFDQYDSQSQLGESPMFGSDGKDALKHKEFSSPPKEDDLWEEKEQVEDTFVVDAKIRKS